MGKSEIMIVFTLEGEKKKKKGDLCKGVHFSWSLWLGRDDRRQKS